VELLSEGIPTVHFQSTLRGIKMQFYSTPTLKKCEPFTTGNKELDDLLLVYNDHAIQMANAEEAGLPEPVLVSPLIPPYITWKKI
jgi:hypothetical protein